MVNASRPGVIFCCRKIGCEEHNEKFNLRDVTGVGQVCLGSRFGRLGYGGSRLRSAMATGIRPSVGASERETLGVGVWVPAGVGYLSQV